MTQRKTVPYRGRALVVYTPTTRRIFSSQWGQILAAISRHAEVVTELEICESDSVRRAMKKYAPDLLVAAGGDGTINLCIQAIHPSETLAALPLGTANDLVRGLRQKAQPTHCIDRIHVNDQAFCTTGGFGIPSTIAQRVICLRKSRLDSLIRKTGKHIYGLVAADLVVRGRSHPQAVEIEWLDADTGEERQLSITTNTLFVTNQSTFGGSLGIVSEAKNDDGHFELCVLKSKTRWRDMVIMGRIAMAVEQGERDTHILRARTAHITTTTPVPFFGDGEIIDTSRHFELEIAPRAVQILDLDWSLDCTTI
jgi:diacylglycerol kinase family enzyme